jgi:hypothetical protein
VVPSGSNPELASLKLMPAANGMATDAATGLVPASASYTKFTSQEALGGFLVKHYNIRTPRELSSCEVCHR